MSNIIKLLPDSVANQIAAGEVIQRPASAVKEMLENAIDAGATKIDLLIKDAGKTLIQVIDNGSGMSAIDVRMSFERHATSKISRADDLFAIRTMGFRGEALASIAAIAQVEVKTKPYEDELGTCLKIEGSKVTGQDPCVCGAGTNILIKNLFFNVPARRNFLKSNAAETRHIIEEFTRASLFQPGIAFSMTQNDKISFKLSSGSLKSRIVGIFGQVYNQRLLPVEQVTHQLRIHGFIGKPEFAKKTRGEQYFFVNGRFIKHAYLNHAVANAYTELIPADSFPSYFLNIEIDPKEIDINIHPTKTEVNFRDARYVYGVLQAAVRQSIGQHSLTPTIDFDVDPAIEAIMQNPPEKPAGQPGVTIDPTYNPFEQNKGRQKDHFTPKPKGQGQDWEFLYAGDGSTPGEGSEEQEAESLPGLSESAPGRFFQSHNRFIMCNVKSGLLVIDQQKAHERILYEKFYQQLSGGEKPSQQQLFPHNIHFSPGDAEIIRTLMNNLNQMGFLLEPFGTSGFVVKGIPADMKESQLEQSLEQIVENHKQQARDLDYDKKVNLARSIAANSSVKEGTKLNVAEMADIFDRLFACQVPEVTPDGKKTMTIIPLADIENKMKN
jgi:DNA mismatch repair protein MutL